MLIIYEAIVLLVSALAIGVIGNIAGIGGGVFLMLIFLFWLRIDPVTAGGLSLLTIISSTSAGSIVNRGKGSIDPELFRRIGFPALFGAIIGSIASFFIVLVIFKLFFGVVVLSIGFFSYLSMRIEISRNRNKDYLLKSFSEYTNTAGEDHSAGRIAKYSLFRSVSFIAGTLSGLFGVGIGAVVGTFLTSIKHVHPKIAFSTVLVTMVLTSAVGAVVHFLRVGLPFYSIILLVPLLIGAAIGGFLGASVSAEMSFKKLRSYQSYIVMFFGTLSIVLASLSLL